MYILTEEDVEVIKNSGGDPNVFFRHFFWKRGASKPFQLDFKFTEDGAWQEDLCLSEENFIVAIAGISTGKTLAVGMSACFMSVHLRSFRFMNIAKDLTQSGIMYQLILEMAKDTLFEHLIVSSPKSPNPQIKIGYMYNGFEHTSILDFRSVGEAGDATNVMSYRGDWINIEEAGLVTQLNVVVANLVTRLTGASAEGREFLGRLSLIANVNDNPYLWDLYDAADEDPDGRTFTVETKDNQNTTPRQIRLAVKLIGDEDIDRYLTGKRPKSAGNYFSAESIEKCSSAQLSEQIRMLMSDEKTEIPYLRDKKLGGVHWELPRDPDASYMIFADPGVKKFPKRDAPVIGVFDVSKAPLYAPMTAFWWGDGRGSITPFNNQLINYIAKYAPLAAGVDSTSTQKHFAQVTSDVLIHGKGYSIDSLTPMDFSGTKKYTYLISLRISIEMGMLQWPDLAEGLEMQMRNYDPLKDRGSSTKLAQDVVSMLSMAVEMIAGHIGHDAGLRRELGVLEPRELERGDLKNRDGVRRERRGLVEQRASDVAAERDRHARRLQHGCRHRRRRRLAVRAGDRDDRTGQRLQGQPHFRDDPAAAHERVVERNRGIHHDDVRRVEVRFIVRTEAKGDLTIAQGVDRAGESLLIAQIGDQDFVAAFGVPARGRDATAEAAEAHHDDAAHS